MLDDVGRASAAGRPRIEGFKVGETVAVTPGKVVYRTPLAEIIQYAPATGAVRPEPVVIVPAWIMKYYILDLSPANSLVRYLVEHGFTVFMISWRNPGQRGSRYGFDDYRTQGVLAALEAAIDDHRREARACRRLLSRRDLADPGRRRDGARSRRPAREPHFVRRAGRFQRCGRADAVRRRGQVAFLEDTMWERGYLDARQMAGAFQLIRSNDLIWSRSSTTT